MRQVIGSMARGRNHDGGKRIAGGRDGGEWRRGGRNIRTGLSAIGWRTGSEEADLADLRVDYAGGPTRVHKPSPLLSDFRLASHTISLCATKEEKIYLGPHGAPPSQSKQQEINSSGRKQRFKQKLREADRRISGSGRENKLENLRDLVGGGKMPGTASKSSPRDWLDPHCHESQF